jgi:dolichol-phosphate mannosyltransferase
MDIQAKKIKLFMVIPAYNEEKNIGLLVENIGRVIKSKGFLYEIIVVNDGSVDATKKTVLNLPKEHAIFLINHEINKGIGAVFTVGLKTASDRADKEDVIVLIEADCTNEPGIINDMIQSIFDGNDVVIGSRYCKGGGYRNFPLMRRLLSIGANNSLRLFFPIRNVKDYTIFFRAYRAEVLKNAFKVYGDNFITASTFVANAEILIKLNRMRIRMSEVPLVYNYGLKKGKSGMKIIKTIKEYCRFIVSGFSGKL